MGFVFKGQAEVSRGEEKLCHMPMGRPISVRRLFNQFLDILEDMSYARFYWDCAIRIFIKADFSTMWHRYTKLCAYSFE